MWTSYPIPRRILRGYPNLNIILTSIGVLSGIPEILPSESSISRSMRSENPANACPTNMTVRMTYYSGHASSDTVGMQRSIRSTADTGVQNAEQHPNQMQTELPMTLPHRSLFYPILQKPNLRKLYRSHYLRYRRLAVSNVS